MLIVQTPLRISFFGGGTDFRGFYSREEGCVLSAAIEKCIFVVVKRRFDARIRVGYTRTELVERLEDVQHDLAREALRLSGVCSQVEINTLGDIPSEGSGLGSSSTVAVGLLNALHHHRGGPRDQEALAREACEIEIERLGKPIGKQDQYIAAYGGLRFIRFLPDESVVVESVDLPEDGRRRLNEHLMLFFTNHTRRSESVLAEQKANIDERMDVLRALKEMAHRGRALLEAGDLDAFGRLLHEGWELKKRMASKISNGSLDAIYQAARQAGALGGKITGAGGGGFLLLFCPPAKQPQVRDALRGLPELPFRLEPDGSKVIFNYRR
ncbi:MAG: GHMP kinase [Anaerolineae bacterium]|jgi:D-glycero-alpha-D-manno-heptose-7-phosphate kinase|nr:GHMP kinase [Anaerolineae bacterium]